MFILVDREEKLGYWNIYKKDITQARKRITFGKRHHASRENKRRGEAHMETESNNTN